MNTPKPWTVVCCATLVVGSLLACKKKSAPAPTVETAPNAGTPSPTPAAPTGAAAPDLSAKTFAVGDTADAGEFKLTLDNVKECKPNPYYRPEKDHIWLGVELAFEGNSDKQVMPLTIYMKVLDKEGTVMKQQYIGSKACEPRFNSSAALGKGEKAKGWLMFEVPKTASGLKFQYSPQNFMGKTQTLKFDLGR